MDKRHVWVISMVAFEGQRSGRSGMISVGHELHMPALKVIHLDFSFEGSDENRSDSAQGGCVVDQRHQVRDEPITCMKPVPQDNADLRPSLGSNQSLSQCIHVFRKLTFTSL